MTGYSAYISRISNLEQNIRASLEFICWTDAVRSESRVFIKPNFTYPYYKEGITTSPEVLRALCGILKDRCDQVIIGESDGGNRSYTADHAFRGHGVDKICRDIGVEQVNLSTLPNRYVEEIIQGKKVKVQVPNLLLDDIDCFVSLPVLKVHVMTTITLSMKNLWGCYPDAMRCLHHSDLGRKLALLTKVINPRLVIVDGTYGLDGHGPMYGTAKRLNLILSSNNPVVADALGTHLMGFDPQDIDHIVRAEREGLGTIDLAKVNLNDDWKQYQQDFTVNKTFVDHLSGLLFRSDFLAKLVMDSPFSASIYKVAALMRNPHEQKVVSDLKEISR
mgnify:CR=1 FL=1|jgi:uncharacterized protein (DUF362 family)